MSAPTTTYSSHGNAYTSGSLAASGSANFDADYSSAKYGGWTQVWNTGGGTVASTNGLQIDVYPYGDSTPNADTESMFSYTLPTVASTAKRKSFFLPNGKYKIVLTNLDTTNAITIEATTNGTA